MLPVDNFVFDARSRSLMREFADLDFERVMDRLEAEGFDFSGVITGRCLSMFTSARPLLDNLCQLAELKDP